MHANPLFPMHHVMLVRVKVYLNEVSNSTVSFLATVLPPSWRRLVGILGKLYWSQTGLNMIEASYKQMKKMKARERFNPQTCHPTLNTTNKNDSKDVFCNHKARAHNTTTNDVCAYLDLAEELSDEVGNKPHLALQLSPLVGSPASEAFLFSSFFWISFDFVVNWSQRRRRQ